MFSGWAPDRPCENSLGEMPCETLGIRDQKSFDEYFTGKASACRAAAIESEYHARVQNKFDVVCLQFDRTKLNPSFRTASKRKSCDICDTPPMSPQGSSDAPPVTPEDHTPPTNSCDNVGNKSLLQVFVG